MSEKDFDEKTLKIFANAVDLNKDGYQKLINAGTFL